MKLNISVFKKLIAIICIFCLILNLTSCVKDRSLVDYFKQVYCDNTTLDEYVQYEKDYYLRLSFPEQKRVTFSMSRTAEGNDWIGELRYSKNDIIVETIPATISNDTVIFHAKEEKQVPLSEIFLFNTTISENAVAERTALVLGDGSAKEVLGHIENNPLKEYMISLYENLLTCFEETIDKDFYYSAIEKSDNFAFTKQKLPDDSYDHQMNIGFAGYESKNWNPGFGNLGNINILLSEGCK